MAKRLGKTEIEFIKDCYEKGKKTGEIQESVKERFGLDVKYHTVYNHSPNSAKNHEAYDARYGRQFSIHARKIAKMADNIEQNTSAPKTVYNFSRNDGERARSRILDYLESNPGAYHRKIKAALDINNGTLIYQLKRMEDTGMVFSRKSGTSKSCKVFYYPLRKTEDRVYYSIQASPDITQAELADKLEIDRPLAYYHAEKLVEGGKITKEKDGHEIRYRATEEKGLSTQEQGTKRRVFNIVKETPGIHLTRLAELLGLAPSTAYYHAEKLAHDHVLSREKDGSKTRYRLAEEK